MVVAVVAVVVVVVVNNKSHIHGGDDWRDAIGDMEQGTGLIGKQIHIGACEIQQLSCCSIDLDQLCVIACTE
jgi:hypothetical protein